MISKAKIQVLGSGCPTCKNLYDLATRAVSELGLDTEVEYLIGEEGVGQIMALRIMSSPVLVVNNKPVMTGFIPDIEKLKSILRENT